jgi:glycosyltransferase involved in cell wall biosynthesis
MARILILCEFPTLSGGERSMLSTLAGVRRAGFEISILAPPGGPLADACAAIDIPLAPMTSHDAAGRRLSLDERRELLAARLEELKPDLLHANSLSMGRLAGPVAAGLGIPSLGHLRDIIKLSRQAVADLNANTRLMAVSDATRRFHVAAGLTPDKTFVLYNGVDLNTFRPRPSTGYLHRELDLPPEPPLIGAIGQICLRKGQDVLLDAALRLEASAHWLIIGERWSDKDESRRFEQQLHEKAERLPGRVHFLGPRSDIPELLDELTILAHPARQEPLGRVLLEAAAAGLPVVATDVGGTGEIFPPDSHSARLVPVDDADAFAAAVSDLLAHPASRDSLAKAARRRAEEQFSIARATANLVEHYRALVQ